MTSTRLTGAFAPAVTPFKADLSPDPDLFLSHCRWLQRQGAGLAVFGTNSEANSLSVAERTTLLDHLIGHGVDPRRMLPGTGCCALPDTVTLTRHATRHGCAGVLVLPPFFYKGVSDDGLFDYYAELIERVALPELRVYLYHIPAFSGVPVSLRLIERLSARFPQQIAGVKDSSGDWANLEAMLCTFPHLSIFPASESLLARAMPLGAAGCISASVNINPAAIAAMCDNWHAPDAAHTQAELDAIRRIVQAFPMIAALKWILAHYHGDHRWQRLRPPLCALTARQQDALQARLRDAGFAMPAPEAA